MNKILRDEKVKLRYTVRLRYKMNINVIYNTYIIYYVPFFINNYFILDSATPNFPGFPLCFSLLLPFLCNLISEKF